jgi:aryl-alcohol dehydrogenase-like predicted oxidoreductase
MKTRRLGRTGLLVGEVGLGGAWLLGRDGNRPMEHGVATVRRALELGVNYVDTAECYIGGRSEEVIGNALDAVDGSCVVATKFGHRPSSFDFSRESVVDSARESLRLLRRTTMDVFQLHTPQEPPLDAIFADGGALDGMREVRDRGWTRFLGITGRDVDFLRRCLETDAFDTMLVFMRYDLLDQSAASLLDEAKDRDVGVVLASPLRMGLFGSAQSDMTRYLSDEERRRLEALNALFANEPGGITGGAVRFVLASDAVSVTLSGATSPEDIERIVELAETPLSREHLSAIRDIGSDRP